MLSDRKEIRDGIGTYYCSNKQKRTNYEYHGAWKHKLRDGHGHCYYYNEDLYVGQWKADKRHGEGDFFSRKQDRYEGHWKNDMRDGKGTLTSPGGAVYTGRWYQDKKHGHGEMQGTDKRVYLEVWKYGVLISRKLKESDENGALSGNSKSLLKGWDNQSQGPSEPAHSTVNVDKTLAEVDEKTSKED